MTPERLNKIRRLVAAGQSPVPSVAQELINEIDRQDAEIGRLRAIVGKLPKTMDGAACAPGDVVYYPEPNDPIVPLTVDSFADWTEDCDDDSERPTRFIAWAMSDRGVGRSVINCYSTREAAEAARKEGAK